MTEIIGSRWDKTEAVLFELSMLKGHRPLKVKFFFVTFKRHLGQILRMNQTLVNLLILVMTFQFTRAEDLALEARIRKTSSASEWINNHNNN